MTEALQRLRLAGLACDARTAPDLHILGGASEFNDGDVRGYERPFAIVQDGSTYVAMVSGDRRRPDRELVFPTLPEAVDCVVDAYRPQRQGSG